MRRISKSFILSVGIVFALPSVANAWCQSCYDGCVSRTWDHIGCALSELFGGDYIIFNPNNGKDINLKKVIDSKILEAKKNKSFKKVAKKRLKYKQICSPKKLATILKNSNLDRAFNSCFKAVKVKRALKAYKMNKDKK